MIHRINVFFLSLVIALSPIILINNANAASLGGWTLGGGVAQGASTLYNGTKNVLINGKNVVQKGVATITPTATGVAKVLARGAGGFALSIAVEELLGAVDWILDPANNQIVYTSSDKPIDPDQPDPSVRFIWSATSTNSGNVYSSPTAAGKESCTYWGWKYKSIINEYIFGGWSYAQALCTMSNGQEALQNLQGKPSPLYNPEAPSKDEQKTLPLDVVAQQIISNAESGDAAAQEATKAAAADIVAEAEKDSTKARPIVNQLESSAETATDETATGETTTKDPTTGETTKTDINLAFPVFCGWAPTVCQAASVVISFPALVTDWWNTSNTKAESWANSISSAWTSVKDWVKTEEPVERQTKVDIEPSVEPEINNSYLQWNAYCPFTAKSDDISINGETSALSSDLTSWCTMASEIKPFVLLAGALASLMIVSGVGLGRGDD